MTPIALVICLAQAAPADPFLHALYDRLHDSPMQQKFRELRPMPFGVVFLPWKGMTEADMRREFRTMKKLGFHNLKQTMPSAEWTQERIMEIALEEGVIPFWYADAGWERITPALLERLGIPPDTKIEELRAHPKMLAHQKEILRSQIRAGGGRAFLGEDEGFKHVPDPLFRPHDIEPFKKWLRATYSSARAVTEAWNLLEVGINPAPFQSWSDVDAYLEKMAQEPDSLRGYGREWSRVRDVLRYKADGRTATVRELTRRAHEANPHAPTRTGGEMGLFLPFAWRAIKMEDLAETQREVGSFYPSIHFAWHYGEVGYEVARPIYMQVSFAADLFKGAWTGAWESTGGPQQTSGAKGWDHFDSTTTPGFSVTAGTISQLFLSYLAGGFKGAGVWTWNPRRAGIEAGEYALLERTGQPGERAIRAGQIAQAAQKHRDELWQAHKEPLVGVLMNWDNDALWAAISVRDRDHFRHYPMRARVGISRALMNGNIPWEHVTVDDLRAGLAPRYRIIYLAGQIALTQELLDLLRPYVEQGGRVVMDAPGGAFDERGVVFPTMAGSAFEKLFGAELADVQYSNNVPRRLEGEKLDGFLLHVKPTKAAVLARFQTGEPAVTEYKLGKGTAVILGWDASYACFRPGKLTLERRLRAALLGAHRSPYACEGAVVYRIAAPEADHYFLINDDEPKTVVLNTSYRYVDGQDPVSGRALRPGEPIALEGYSARWVRFRKPRP